MKYNYLTLILLIGLILLQGCQPQENKVEQKKPLILFDRIVCSRGPWLIASLEVTPNREYVYSGEIFGEVEVEHGMYEHHFVGKLQETDLQYFQQLINGLETKANQDEPVRLHQPFYYMRVYNKNGYKEYEGQHNEIWEELFEYCQKIKMQKVKGRKYYETREKVIMLPLPDVSNQPEIEEIKE